MKYTEIKKKLQSLQKMAHDAAKDLPESYEIITEITERKSRNDDWYCYRLAVYEDDKYESIKSCSGNIYSFRTDEQNSSELEKVTAGFFAFLEELKNTNR